MTDIAPEPGSLSMPDPVELACTGCGTTSAYDATSKVAKAEVTLYPDCAFPERSGQ